MIDGARQHAAGEDVAADEIELARDRPAKELFGDGDDLQPGAAAGREPVAQLPEEDRPVSLADRLEHLDRGDAVVDAALVAIVLQLDLHLLGEPRLGDARAAR